MALIENASGISGAVTRPVCRARLPAPSSRKLPIPRQNAPTRQTSTSMAESSTLASALPMLPSAWPATSLWEAQPGRPSITGHAMPWKAAMPLLKIGASNASGLWDRPLQSLALLGRRARYFVHSGSPGAGSYSGLPADLIVYLAPGIRSTQTENSPSGSINAPISRIFPIPHQHPSF